MQQVSSVCYSLAYIVTEELLFRGNLHNHLKEEYSYDLGFCYKLLLISPELIYMYIFVGGFSGAYKIYNRGGIYPMGLMTGIIIIIMIIIIII